MARNEHNMKNYEMNTTIYKRTASGKSWAYKPYDVTTEIISETEHANHIDDKTLKFFRSLGGYERNYKGYTKHGYTVIKNVSIDPERCVKIVRIFKAI